jgi:recombination protein RecA
MKKTAVKNDLPKYLECHIKEYGKIMSSGIEILNEKKDYKMFSVGPILDIALGGGVKEGSWVILTGDPKSGKSTTSLQMAANAQRDGRKVIYLDVEGRLKEMNFDIDGLDPEQMTIIAPEDKPLPAEVFLDVGYKLMTDPEYHGALMIIDSLSSLIPEKELTGDMTPGRAGLPKLLSIFTKKMGQVLPRQRGVIICITHYIANTSGYGAAKMADGGNKIQYQADTRLEVRSNGAKVPAVAPWVDANGEQIGQIVNWKILCSSVGPPGGNAQSYIRYGHGIDKCQEYLILGQDLGLIEKSSAWIKFVYLVNEKDFLKEVFEDLEVEDEEKCLKKLNFQGEAKAYDFLKSNPKALEILEKTIKEML